MYCQLAQVVVREIDAGEQLFEELRCASTPDPEKTDEDIEVAEKVAFSKWGTALTVPEVVRFATNMQRESGGRAEISNLKHRELRIEFHAVTEQPSITKARCDGNTEP